MTQKRISSFLSRAAAISLALMASVAVADAQGSRRSSQRNQEEAKEDSVAFFRGVAVSADVLGLAQIAFSDYGQY